MEVEYNNKKYSKTYLDRELTLAYQEAMKEDDFKQFIKKLNLNEDIAKKYTTRLLHTVNELSNCRSCKNYLDCKNNIKGCVSYPKIDDNIITFSNIECKYLTKIKENEKLKATFFEEPMIIRNARMKDIDVTDKKRAKLLKWIDKFYKEYQKDHHIKGLYLHGSFGSGKSYIISALLNELASNGNKCIIVYYPEMLRRLKESFSSNFEELMRDLKKCDVLLFDDLGAETVSEWSRDEILGTILQYRMDEKLPTFFTSNLDIEELEIHLSNTKNGVDLIKARRIMERIKCLTEDMELISENKRK